MYLLVKQINIIKGDDSNSIKNLVEKEYINITPVNLEGFGRGVKEKQRVKVHLHFT